MTLPTPNEFLQKLDETRRRLEADIEALRNQLRGVELAYQALGGKVAALERRRAGRGNVKGLLLELLKEAGTEGLNAQIAVRMASDRGVALDRNTASSLLSRLKVYGIAWHDGTRYFLQDAASRTQDRPAISRPQIHAQAV